MSQIVYVNQKDVAAREIYPGVRKRLLWQGPNGAKAQILESPLFWGSLGFALAVAAVAAFPINRWLIARGKGHAVVHAYHRH